MRVHVPAIGVDAAVAAVGVDASGQMAVPPDGTTTAWYRHGPAPGDDGSAVVAGHVDYAGQPGVFFRLRDLGDGDRVVVDYDDGSRQEFTVRESRSYTKVSLPVDEMFTRAPWAVRCSRSSPAGARSTPASATTATTSWCGPPSA